MMSRRRFLAASAGTVALAPRAEASMDTNKMQAVAAAITSAGFDAVLSKQDDGSWKVRARSKQVDIPVASAQALAIAQGVTAYAAEIEFV